MRSQITVILGNGDELKYALSEADLADMDSATATEWLAHEFEAAGGTVPNRLGKLLTLDRVIVLAQGQPEAAFTEPTPWVKKFLRAVAASIGRRSIIIDLRAGSLSYY